MVNFSDAQAQILSEVCVLRSGCPTRLGTKSVSPPWLTVTRTIRPSRTGIPARRRLADDRSGGKLLIELFALFFQTQPQRP